MYKLRININKCKYLNIVLFCKYVLVDTEINEHKSMSN